MHWDREELNDILDILMKNIIVKKKGKYFSL